MGEKTTWKCDGVIREWMDGTGKIWTYRFLLEASGPGAGLLPG